MQLLAIALASAPLFALADTTFDSPSRRRALHARHAHSRATKTYNLVDKYTGDDFFK